MSWNKIDEVARIFDALASKTRLEIIKIILEFQSLQEPIHIKGVADRLGMDYGLVYRHIEALKRVGLLTIYSVGRSRVPRVKKPEKLRELLDITLKLL